MSFWDGSRWTDDRPVRPALRAPTTRTRRLRDWLATIPILLLVPALIIPMVPVGARSASLTVDGVAVAGGQITVLGTGFPGRESVQLAWDGGTGGMPLVTTNPRGRFSAPIIVPAGASAGTHTVSAFVLPSGKGGDKGRSSLESSGTDALATVTVAVTTETPGPTPAPSAAAPASQPPGPTAAPSQPPGPTSAPSQPPTPTSAPTQPPSPTAPPPNPTAPPPNPTVPPPNPTATPAPAGLNVRDYGAKGDGTSNDTAAFNAALQASLTRGKVVYVPNGTYALTRLIMPAGVTLRGQDRGATVLKRYGLGAHAAGGFIHIENVADVSLENLTLRGTGKRLSDTGQTGRGDDILINVINGRNVRARNLTLQDAQGCGIQTEGSGTYGGLFEDISITDTYVRDNGYHGVALWPYKGTHANTFRRITIDGADYAGIMIDAGTTGSTDAAGVDDNIFEDIVIRNAARYHMLGGGVGAGWMFTGGKGNRVNRYEITDIPQGSAMAFGADQSGIGSTLNTLATGKVARVASGTIAAFGGGATGNTFNGGSGSGHIVGASGNTFINWPGLIQ